MINRDRPFALPRKKLDPMDYLIHMGVVQLFARESRRPLDVVMREIYGDDELHKEALQWTMRAATAPAMTTVTGWAAELSQQTYTAFMETLYAKAIFPRLSALGLTLTFGPYGKIIIPTRATTPTIAGSFVGEGMPIPVRQGLLASQTLTPKKMAVITTFTREISEHQAYRRSRACCARRCRGMRRSRSIPCCSTPIRRLWCGRPASSTRSPD